MMQIRKERVLLLLFALMLAGAWLVWPWAKGHLDTANYEKRELAPFPALNRGFPPAFEEYVNDRMPFRNQMIKANSLLDYRVFGTDTTGKVIVGKDGWLFLRDSSDGSALADYKGENLYSETDLQEFAINLQETKNALAAAGAEFVVYIAPDKERMYPEYLPDCYGKPAEMFTARQVMEYVLSHTDVRIIWGMEDLLAAKTGAAASAAASAADGETAETGTMAEAELLYFPADTHWNHLGAYIGARTLLKELGIAIPSPDAPEMKKEHYLNEAGDLAMLVHLADVFGLQEDIRVTGYDTHGMTEDSWDFATAFRYRTENGDPRKLMVIRDSFGTAWSDVLGAQFKESVMFHRDYYQPEMFYEEMPDIVVYECVERQLPALKDYNTLKR
ncbi:MAG: hypothetical protein J5947_03625 [Clostridium sp.]|nr:hypothetical protein [Clostridium sp.]